MITSNIKPLSINKLNAKQSPCTMNTELLMTFIILGPAGSCKSILLQYIIMDIYKDYFEHINIVSANIRIDKI